MHIFKALFEDILDTKISFRKHSSLKTETFNMLAYLKKKVFKILGA